MRIDQAVEKGAAFIQSTQLPDGSFDSVSSPTANPFDPTMRYKTTFVPSLILAALAHTDTTTSKLIRNRLADWLLQQKSQHWSFNYWAAAAPERITKPYPDDLDDTFCALIGLRAHDASLITETCLANVVKLLVATESQVGGPYRTWLISNDAPDTWQDIDLAVNSNIAYFLSQVADPLPNLTTLMETAIITTVLTSPYYPSMYPVVYYMSRAYHGAYTSELATHMLKQRRDGWWQTPLQSALAICALVRLGRADACPAAIDHLIDCQQADGSWPAEAFCLDPAIAKQTHYNGAAALTTALVIEALSLYEQSLVVHADSESVIPGATSELHDQINSMAERDLASLDVSLRNSGQAILARVQQSDHKHEITLLPHFFNQSLKIPLGPAAANYLQTLGLANLYGWAAYTIYDDFLDDEGNPTLLPFANIALRQSLAYFRKALPDSQAFQELVANTFTTIDEANAWEVAACRFDVREGRITIGKLPDYGNLERLAERSLGHTLTPLGILAAAGIEPGDRRAHAIQQALKHYIIARQLNDDLHDWEADLRAGHATYVVSAILREIALPPGTYTTTSLLLPMQQQLWQHTLNTVCEVIRQHTAAARSAVLASDLLQDRNVITQVVDAVDHSITTALHEQAKAREFLVTYRTTYA